MSNDNEAPFLIACTRCGETGGTRMIVGDYPAGVTFEQLAEKLARHDGWRNPGGEWICPAHPVEIVA